MMKNKIAKYIVNGVVLAAMAAIGITVYQLGTSPRENTVPEEIQTEEDMPQEEPLVDAGTSQVEADMENATELPYENMEEAAEDASEKTDEEAEVPGTDTETSVDMETSGTSATAYTGAQLHFSEETFMEWPVNGNILLDYSMDQTTYFPTLDQYKLSSAIAVQAVEGAPVLAAADGQVYSIEQNAQTGTTLTMELGNGYQAIYGQLKDLTVEEGELVSEGTIIGYISSPTKYYSEEGSNLYFAMKKDGKPIDPILYLP